MKVHVGMLQSIDTVEYVSSELNLSHPYQADPNTWTILDTYVRTYTHIDLVSHKNDGFAEWQERSNHSKHDGGQVGGTDSTLGLHDCVSAAIQLSIDVYL